WRGKLTLNIRFAQAPGVSQGTPVRKSGILIGRVSEVKFADDGGVIVVVSIRGDVPLRTSEVARITGSILGDAVIEFVPGAQPSTTFMASDDYINGTVARNPLE